MEPILRILLIDDDASLIMLLAKYLNGLDYQVTTAGNGQQGLDLFFESHAYDAVITDIKMPEVNGLEVLKRIRQEDEETPIILMTGHSEIDTTIEALRMGALDFILKPFNLKELEEVLKKIRTIRHMLQEPLKVIPYVQQDEVQVVIPSHTELINSSVIYFHSRFRPFCQSYYVDHNKISLCLQEALTNAVIHGNLDIDSEVKEADWDEFDALVKEREKDPQYGQKTVSLYQQVVARNVEENGEATSVMALEFTVEDQGKGYDTSLLPDFSDPLALLSVSGRGLLIIHSFMDEVRWNEKGNQITMVKYLQPPDEAA